MRVVITGAGGFIGRHLVTRLLAEDVEVVAVDIDLADTPAGAELLAGDLSDRNIRSAALDQRPDALVHLATLPGGAAEADPVAGRRINLDASYDLLCEAGERHPGLRVVYASTIAVFGDRLPPTVKDDTPLNPRMYYGAHKAMIEAAVTMLSNRAAIDAISLRLPGILARPGRASGLKSAFLSDLFHSMRGHQPFQCPVSLEGTIWAQSLACCTGNLAHALSLDSAVLPPNRAVTLPALRVRVADLVDELARQCGTRSDLVTYAPDADLEAAFAANPPLETPAAERAGFAHDGDLASLVASALATLQ